MIWAEPRVNIRTIVSENKSVRRYMSTQSSSSKESPARQQKKKNKNEGRLKYLSY